MSMRCSILALAMLIACKEKIPEPPPPPPPPPHDGVTLIQPGAAPHHPLRYRLAPGTATVSEVIFDFDLKNDGQSGPVPTLVIEFETAIVEVLPDGNAKLQITIVGTSVRERPESPATSELMRSQAAAMRGVVITQTLAPDGTLGDAHVAPAGPSDKPQAGPSDKPQAGLPDKPQAGLSDKVRAQLENLIRSLEQVAVRLPLEPVGIGATWRVRKTLPEGGIRAVSETLYTLTSLSGNVVAYTSAGLLSGAPQTVEQSGMTAEVTSVHGSTEGKGSIDLSRYAFAVSSTSRLTTAMNVAAPEGTPGAGSSTIEITMAIQVTPRDAAAVGEAPATAPAPDPSAAQ